MAISPETDAAGETDRMEALVREHQAALLRYAARMLGEPDAAQDVVQNVFIKLFKRARALPAPDDAALRHWLYRVTHNEAIDYARRESRLRAMHERHAEDCGIRAAAQDCAVEERDRHEQVLALIRMLKPAERQVLLLRLQEGLSYKDISRITGRTTGNVGCLLHNAIRNLAALMREQGAGRGPIAAAAGSEAG